MSDQCDFKVGDYVLHGHSSSRGFVYKITAIQTKTRELRHYAGPNTQKTWLALTIKPVYGLFNTHERKATRNVLSSALKLVDLTAFGVEYIRLGEFIKAMVKERSE